MHTNYGSNAVAAFVGKMMKQTKYQQQNENETSPMYRHLLHFSLQEIILVQLMVLKVQHYHVIDSLRTVACCEYKIYDCLDFANCIKPFLISLFVHCHISSVFKFLDLRSIIRAKLFLLFDIITVICVCLSKRTCMQKDMPVA